MKKLIIAIIVIAALAFGWWTISPLFINVEVQDELDPELLALIEESDTLPEPESVDVSVPEALETDPTAPVLTSTPIEEPKTTISALVPIQDTRGHPASGQVRVIQTPDETMVRFEDYDGTNGPDLRIYLATDLEATEFIDLGVAKGNRGNINYTVPAGVDIDEYQYVMTWCRAFGVLFDYAEIN